MNRTPDIVIFGAGIAGLWAHNRFQALGYDSLLLEAHSIGGGQTIASQGIIHSGLKYAFAGKVNKLAQSISAMPDLWRAALQGLGDVNLSTATVNAHSQQLLIPSGFMGGLVNLVTQQVLGNGAHEIKTTEWPAGLKSSGFKGRAVFMGEPVLDVESVLRALAEPYKDSIRKIDTPDDPFGFLGRHNIHAKHIIFTCAGSNAEIAKAQGHDEGLKTQMRPLLQGMLCPAPFELYAHLVGKSDKPICSITTHKKSNGELVWYFGASVAEREKEADPREVYDGVKNAFAKYMPHVDLSDVQWAVLPIDRVEGKSDVDGWMPDTPTIHSVENAHYCWPTKLTFAPLLTDRLLEKVGEPSHNNCDWADLENVGYAKAPWDKATWTKIS